MTAESHPRLQTFLSLGWYDEAIKFIFHLVTKTSTVLLTAGIVVSTANFLTDGDVMNHNKALSDGWAWAQAIAIDASLGDVFLSAIVAFQQRDRIKAIIFAILTTLLATVAGLITHFDAYSHASGLPVTAQEVSGIIPLWLMTALRAIAVIGVLLTSRLKQISFQEHPLSTPARAVGEQKVSETMVVPIHGLRVAQAQLPRTSELATQQGHGVSKDVSGGRTHALRVLHLLTGRRTEDHENPLEPETNPSAQKTASLQRGEDPQTDDAHGTSPLSPPLMTMTQRPEGGQESDTSTKIAHAYQILLQERQHQQSQKPISARELAMRANVRRSTCSAWLQQYGMAEHRTLLLEQLNTDQREEIAQSSTAHPHSINQDGPDETGKRVLSREQRQPAEEVIV